MNFLKRLLCDHDLKFVRNIYGDEINQISPPNKTIRSIYMCEKCRKIIYSTALNMTENKLAMFIDKQIKTYDDLKRITLHGGDKVYKIRGISDFAIIYNRKVPCIYTVYKNNIRYYAEKDTYRLISDIVTIRKHYKKD